MDEKRVELAGQKEIAFVLSAAMGRTWTIHMVARAAARSSNPLPVRFDHSGHYYAWQDEVERWAKTSGRPRRIPRRRDGGVNRPHQTVISRR